MIFNNVLSVFSLYPCLTEWKPVCFNNFTQSSGGDWKDFLSESMVKNRLYRLLYQVSEDEDTVECWEAMLSIEKQFGMKQSASLCIRLTLAKEKAKLEQERLYFESWCTKSRERRKRYMSYIESENTKYEEESKISRGYGQFLNLLGSKKILKSAGYGDEARKSLKRQRLDESDTNKNLVVEIERKHELAYLLRRAKQSLCLGEYSESASLFSYVLSQLKKEMQAHHVPENLWHMRKDALYGSVQLDIAKWESESNGLEKEKQSDSIVSQLFHLLRDAGPPEKLDELSNILGFLVNSKKWMVTAEHGAEEAYSSVLSKYCQQLESICSHHIQQQQQHQLPFHNPQNPQAWNVPPHYLDTVRATVVLGHLTHICEAYVHSLLDESKKDLKDKKDSNSVTKNEESMDIEAESALKLRLNNQLSIMICHILILSTGNLG